MRQTLFNFFFWVLGIVLVAGAQVWFIIQKPDHAVKEEPNLFGISIRVIFTKKIYPKKWIVPLGSL